MAIYLLEGAARIRRPSLGNGISTCADDCNCRGCCWLCKPFLLEWEGIDLAEAVKYFPYSSGYLSALPCANDEGDEFPRPGAVLNRSAPSREWPGPIPLIGGLGAGYASALGIDCNEGSQLGGVAAAPTYSYVGPLSGNEFDIYLYLLNSCDSLENEATFELGVITLRELYTPAGPGESCLLAFPVLQIPLYRSAPIPISGTSPGDLTNIYLPKIPNALEDNGMTTGLPSNAYISLLGGRCTDVNCAYCTPAPGATGLTPVVVDFDVTGTGCIKQFSAQIPECLGEVEVYWSEGGAEGQTVSLPISHYENNSTTCYADVTMVVVDDRGCIYTKTKQVTGGCCGGATGGLSIELIDSDYGADPPWEKYRITASVSNSSEDCTPFIELCNISRSADCNSVSVDECLCEGDASAVGGLCPTLSDGDHQDWTLIEGERRCFRWLVWDDTCGCPSPVNYFKLEYGAGEEPWSGDNCCECDDPEVELFADPVACSNVDGSEDPGGTSPCIFTTIDGSFIRYIVDYTIRVTTHPSKCNGAVNVATGLVTWGQYASPASSAISGAETVVRVTHTLPYPNVFDGECIEITVDDGLGCQATYKAYPPSSSGSLDCENA